MVLLIKNKHASFESVSPAGDTPSGRLAKLRVQSLRNAGVPKAKSLPHINLLVEGGSLREHCALVLNADLQKLKPKIARRVKSAKEDLRQLFDNTSPKQRIEPTRPRDSISTELICSTTVPDLAISSPLDSSSSLGVSVPAPLDEHKDEDEDHIHCLTAVAHSWLDFERLFSRRRALSDQTVEEARHDFCQTLVRSLSDRSPIASLSQSFSDLVDLPPFRPICSSPGYSPAPSATTWANQTTITVRQFESTVEWKPPQLPEFSDEELEREFDNFSFHSSQDEEWTSEVESRKQNAMNRVFSDIKRKLAVPVPQLSFYFSDDSLADSATHRTLVNPRQSCSGVSSREDDNTSSYSADQEDGTEEDDKSVSVSIMPPDPTVCTATPVVDAAIRVPACPAELSLSSQMVDLTSGEEKDDPGLRVEHIEDGIENVWDVQAIHVPRPLTRTSEESLANECEIEPTAQPPPLSFRRPNSQHKRCLWFKRQCTSILDPIDEIDSAPAALLTELTGSSETVSSNTGTSAVATDTENDPSSSSVLGLGKTLRRVRNFVDLKNPVILPTVQSTSSIETTCETISLHEEARPSASQGRRLRRVPGYLDLRKAFGGTDMSIETSPSLHSISDHSLQRSSSFEERPRSSDLEEGRKILPVSPRCHVLMGEDSAKPPIPPKPFGFRLRQKGIQLSSATIHEPSSPCSRCDPLLSLPLWSCAKITRSKGKRGRPLGESTKVLKKRLDSICVDPETIHGHPPPRRGEKPPSILSIKESRKTKTSKFWKAREK